MVMNLSDTFDLKNPENETLIKLCLAVISVYAICTVLKKYLA
jgi:hypothetical protein